ncbi:MULTISPECIES: hypothetical protein [Rhizobium]|nr:hypothetical protein [Rhizobium acaciae]
MMTKLTNKGVLASAGRGTLVHLSDDDDEYGGDERGFVP